MAVLATARSVLAEVTLVGKVVFAGSTADPHADSLPSAVRHRLGGFGAIDYTGNGNRYVLLPDRGPDDGNSTFHCRIHEVELVVAPRAREPVSLRWLGTRLLRDEQRVDLVGSSAAFDVTRPDGGLRFDAEGVRVLGDRTFVSDEYGPHLVEFDATGVRRRLFTIPSYYRIKTPKAALPEEIASNAVGRISNRGFESLAITPDGQRMVAVTQSPLIQDAEPGEMGRLYGRHCRILEIELSTGRTRQFAYPLADVRNGVSDILAIGGHEFLVLERDGLAGEKARYKRIVRIDTSNATDISSWEKLPPQQLPDDIRPVTRHEFLDLLDPRFALAGADLPEKFEGMTFGPPLSDGRRLLIVSVDNDFVETQPSQIIVFAMSGDELPGYAWQYPATPRRVAGK